jgi:hypothetical protein
MGSLYPKKIRKPALSDGLILIRRRALVTCLVQAKAQLAEKAEPLATLHVREHKNAHRRGVRTRCRGRPRHCLGEQLGLDHGRKAGCSLRRHDDHTTHSDHARRYAPVDDDAHCPACGGTAAEAGRAHAHRRGAAERRDGWDGASARTALRATGTRLARADADPRDRGQVDERRQL